MPCSASENQTNNINREGSTPQGRPLIPLSPEEQLWIDEHPSITVSNEFDWPPFDFTHSGKPHGFGIDLMNLISKYSGIKFNYVNGYTWDELVEKYENGEIDLLHSVFMTPARKEKSLFSPPYYHTKNVFIFRHDTPKTTSINDLEGKIIALPKGWSSIELFKTHYPNIHIIEVANTKQALEYVNQSKVYATVEQEEIAQYFLRRFGFHDLQISEWIDNTELQQSRSMHFSVLKSNPILYAILTRAQNNIPLEMLNRLKDKWFSYDARKLGGVDVGLTPSERNFLENKESISYCVPPDIMPFASIKDGEIDGMAADYINIFSDKLNIPFKLIPTTSWKDSQYKFTTGECEVLPMLIMPGTMNVTHDLTGPLFRFQAAIITREDEGFIAGLQHFMGKKLAIVKYGFNQGNSSSLYSHISILPFETTLECLLQVANGTTDGALLALPIAAHYIRYMGLTNLKIAGYTGAEGSIRIGIKKDTPNLHSIMSKLIRSISQNEINTISEKWISLQFEHKFNYSTLWKVFTGIALLVIVILFWNRKLFHLNKKIAEANRKLEAQSKELKRISITDVLTGLYNRRYADNKLEKEIFRATRYQGNLSLIMTDLDNFKKVNDEWGHQVGDNVLQVFANVLTENTRESDLVSRWGGEEFLILCPETDLKGAISQAEHLRKTFSQTELKDVGSKTASFGVATYSPGESKNSFVQRADEALYSAKNKGRNRVESA